MGKEVCLGRLQGWAGAAGKAAVLAAAGLGGCNLAAGSLHFTLFKTISILSAPTIVGFFANSPSMSPG